MSKIIFINQNKSKFFYNQILVYAERFFSGALELDKRGMVSGVIGPPDSESAKILLFPSAISEKNALKCNEICMQNKWQLNQTCAVLVLTFLSCKAR